MKRGSVIWKKSLKYKNIFIDFLNLNTFPRVYKKSKDIIYFRKKFLKILNHINSSKIIDKLTGLEKINIVQSKTNFNLPYQQKNDLDLNQKYYLLLEKILGKDKNININKFKSNKIFFISGFFFKHTVSKLFLILLKNFQRKKI